MKKIALYILGAFALLLQNACSDLEETVYSSQLSTNFFSSAEEIEGAYMRPWSHLGFVDTYHFIKLRTLGTDMAAWTTKTSASHGYDQAKWIDLHRHNWSDRHETVESSWNTVYEGVGFCNAILEGIADKDFEKLEVAISKEEMQSQLRAYRAYMHMIALDFWGNVPVVTQVGVPYYPGNSTAKEVFDFVESEFLAVKDVLPDAFEPYAVGFFSKQSVEGFLARLYLNAEIYIDEPMYSEAAMMCDAVIGSNLFVLENKYLDVFSVKNHQSKENIQLISMAGGSSFAAPLHALTCFWNNHVGNNTGWNGIITLEKFYDSYNDNDTRKKQYKVGPQFFADGEPVLIDPKDPDKGQVIYTKELTKFHSDGLLEGARCAKYEAQDGLGWNQEYDIVLLRYAEVLLNKAEAIMRQNGGQANQAAVDLVNQVRNRAFGDNYEANKYTTATLTLDELLAERGRELAYEGHRRTDMIRFGTYLGTRWEKTSQSEDYRKLYPIPAKQIDINPNLTQNKGY